MKKMKFCKLSRVLISISLLAIIAVSLISVPVSAATADYPDLVGLWKVGEDFSDVTGTLNTNTGFNVSVRLPYLNDGEIDYFEWNGCKLVINVNDSRTIGFEFTPQYASDDLIQYREGVIYFRVAGVTNATISIDSEFYDQLRVIEFTDDTITGWDSGTDPSRLYNAIVSYCTPYVPPQPRSLLDNILGTFSEVGSWIGTIISSLVALFWSVETASLTFLGILSVAGLAFSVIMLLFGIVSRFVGFSG